MEHSFHSKVRNTLTWYLIYNRWYITGWDVQLASCEGIKCVTNLTTHFLKLPLSVWHTHTHILHIHGILITLGWTLVVFAGYQWCIKTTHDNLTLSTNPTTNQSALLNTNWDPNCCMTHIVFLQKHIAIGKKYHMPYYAVLKKKV